MSKIRGIKLLRRPKQLTGILVGVDGDVPYIQAFDLRTIKLFKNSSSNLSIVRSFQLSPLCVAKKNVVRVSFEPELHIAHYHVSLTLRSRFSFNSLPTYFSENSRLILTQSYVYVYT